MGLNNGGTLMNNGGGMPMNSGMAMPMNNGGMPMNSGGGMPMSSGDNMNMHNMATQQANIHNMMMSMQGILGMARAQQPPMQSPNTFPSKMASSSRGGGGGNAPCPWKLFVGQVPFEATEQHLIPVFSQYGEIVNIMVLRKPGTNQSRGCAFVTYDTQEQAQSAIDNISGKLCLPGDSRSKPLLVNLASAKGQG